MKIGTVFKLLIPVVLLAAIGGYAFLQSTPIAVVAKVDKGIAVHAVPGTVNVLAEKEMEIKGEHGGRVTVSNMKIGARVSEGDVLVELDTGDVDIAIERAEDEYGSAKERIEIGSPLLLELEARKETLKDVQYQFDLGGVREVDLNNARRAVQKAEDDIVRDRLNDESLLLKLDSELKRLKRQKEKMTIRSPIAGIVTKIFAHQGDLIGNGQAIAQVVSLTRIVEVKISEENFAGVQPGLPARVAFLGIENERFGAVVEKVIPVADAQSQRFAAHLNVDIELSRLNPGLTGDATITLDERDNALRIPRSALVQNSVLTVTDGVVTRKEVTLGYGSITMMEILDGLSEGEQVIVEDLHLFQSGDRVRVVLKQ